MTLAINKLKNKKDFRLHNLHVPQAYVLKIFTGSPSENNEEMEIDEKALSSASMPSSETSNEGLDQSLGNLQDSLHSQPAGTTCHVLHV